MLKGTGPCHPWFWAKSLCHFASRMPLCENWPHGRPLQTHGTQDVCPQVACVRSQNHRPRPPAHPAVLQAAPGPCRALSPGGLFKRGSDATGATRSWLGRAHA